MPDADGKLKGLGWSRAAAASWERIFGPAHRQVARPSVPDLMAALEASLSSVPAEPPHEVLRGWTDVGERDAWTPEDYAQR